MTSLKEGKKAEQDEGNEADPHRYRDRHQDRADQRSSRHVCVADPLHPLHHGKESPTSNASTPSSPTTHSNAFMRTWYTHYDE
jgi:hypothetical protein